ncbi:MAG: hypothetical protein JWO86_5825 [Myxococcaceae bacterium]|nr:hypothetical protein [Myxococcaceae bacterium]
MHFGSNHFGAALGIAVTVASLSAACSSSGSPAPTSESDGGPNATGGNDAAGTSRYFCPPEAPGAGTSCPGDIVCEYGTDPIFPCNTIAECRANTWKVRPPDTANGNCPSTTICRAAKNPDNTTQCITGRWCQAMDGNCQCLVNAATGGTRPSWSCAAPSTGCAAVLPRAGTPCPYEAPDDADGARCPLVDCTMICVHKRWEPEADCTPQYGL